jgi:hypothetical protein
MRTIEYRNTFHNTSVRVRVRVTDLVESNGQDPLRVRLSPAQVRRVRWELCGISDCCCGSHSNFSPPLSDSGWCEGGRVVETVSEREFRDAEDGQILSHQSDEREV